MKLIKLKIVAQFEAIDNDTKEVITSYTKEITIDNYEGKAKLNVIATAWSICLPPEPIDNLNHSLRLVEVTAEAYEEEV